MKRELLVSVTLGGVAAAFGVVSLLVWATRGRNARLLRRKLSLGATLLSLTAASAGCGDDGWRDITCYAPVPVNYIDLGDDLPLYDRIDLDLDVDRTIHGTISGRRGQTFSFRVTDPGGQEEQRDALVPDDGAYDESDEAFTIEIRSDLTPGDYTLAFFDLSADAIGDGSSGRLRQITLRILEK